MSSSTPCQLCDMPPFALLREALTGTAIELGASRTAGNVPLPCPAELQSLNGLLFTSGSAPRELWVRSGHGCTLQVVDIRGLDVASCATTLIDLSSQTLNVVLGLNDAWVKARQIALLLDGVPHFITVRLGFDLYYSYARRLLSCLGLPEGEYCVNHRSCNGSDAVELAVHAAFVAAAEGSGTRDAQVHAKARRCKIAVFAGSYHGQNLHAALVSDHQPSLFLVGRPPEVVMFATPRLVTPTSLVELDDATEATLHTLEREGDCFCAVLIEPIQVRNAIHSIPTAFLRRLREICTARSICLIFDEIQTAFGYLGAMWYGGLEGNVVPDIAVFSKGLTSGHGALAVTVHRRRYRLMEPTFTGKTNAGSLLALVAADAVLDRLVGVEEDRLAAVPSWVPTSLHDALRPDGCLLAPHVFEPLAQALASMLSRLCSLFPSLLSQNIQGRGMLRGIAVVNTDGSPDVALCAWMCNRALSHGVYVRQNENCITIKPALVLTEVELESAFRSLCATCGDAMGRRLQA